MNILTLIFILVLAIPIYVLAQAKNWPFVIIYLIFYAIVLGNAV